MNTEKQEDIETMVSEKKKKRRMHYIMLRNKYKRLIDRLQKLILMKHDLEEEAEENKINITNLRLPWEREQELNMRVRVRSESNGSLVPF